jgi:hypothetical protein
MYDYFGVGTRPKAVSLGSQPFAVFGEVIYLTIEDYTDSVVLVGHRLAAFGSKVDNGKSAVPERDTWTNIVTLIIGAAVTKRVAHADNDARVDTLGDISANDAADSAHFQ